MARRPDYPRPAADHPLSDQIGRLRVARSSETDVGRARQVAAPLQGLQASARRVGLVGPLDALIRASSMTLDPPSPDAYAPTETRPGD